MENDPFLDLALKNMVDLSRSNSSFFSGGPSRTGPPAPTATESATEDGRHSSQGDLAQLAVQQLFVPGPLGSPEPRRTGDETGGKNGGKIDGSNGVPLKKPEDESKIPPSWSWPMPPFHVYFMSTLW